MPHTYTNEANQTFEVIPVHKRDHEGSLFVDRRTGAIVTPIMERPEWSEGLAVALLAEHREFYTKRTGAYEEPELLDADDLGWLGMTDEGEMEIFAMEDFRQERLAGLLSVDLETGDVADALAMMEHSMDIYRTDEQIAALEDSQGEGFEDVRKASNG